MVLVFCEGALKPGPVYLCWEGFISWYNTLVYYHFQFHFAIATNNVIIVKIDWAETEK